MELILNLASEHPLWTTFILIALAKYGHYLLNRFGKVRGYRSINPNQQRWTFRSLLSDLLLMAVYVHGLTLLLNRETVLMGMVIAITVAVVSYDSNRTLAREDIPMNRELISLIQRFGNKRTFAYYCFSDIVMYGTLTLVWALSALLTAASP